MKGECQGDRKSEKTSRTQEKYRRESQNVLPSPETDPTRSLVLLPLSLLDSPTGVRWYDRDLRLNVADVLQSPVVAFA